MNALLLAVRNQLWRGVVGVEFNLVDDWRDLIILSALLSILASNENTAYLGGGVIQ